MHIKNCLIFTRKIGQAKKTEHKIANWIGLFFVVRCRKFEVTNLLDDGLAPVRIAPKVSAIFKMLPNSNENCPFEVGDNPLDSTKRHDLLKKYLISNGFIDVFF
jgi:hypothetical protein